MEDAAATGLSASSNGVLRTHSAGSVMANVAMRCTIDSLCAQFREEEQ